jgi:hypothetical protein
MDVRYGTYVKKNFRQRLDGAAQKSRNALLQGLKSLCGNSFDAAVRAKAQLTKSHLRRGGSPDLLKSGQKRLRRKTSGEMN